MNETEYAEAKYRTDFNVPAGAWFLHQVAEREHQRTDVDTHINSMAGMVVRILNRYGFVETTTHYSTASVDRRHNDPAAMAIFLDWSKYEPIPVENWPVAAEVSTNG